MCRGCTHFAHRSNARERRRRPATFVVPLRPEQHRILFSFVVIIVIIIIVVDDDDEDTGSRAARKGQDLTYKRDRARERKESLPRGPAITYAPLSDPAGFAVGCASFLSVPQPLCIMHPALRARPPILFIYFFSSFSVTSRCPISSSPRSPLRHCFSLAERGSVGKRRREIFPGFGVKRA